MIGGAPATCLPWWYSHLDKKPRTKIVSGCHNVGGRVNCAPEAMRAAAEAKLVTMGEWRGRLPLAVYTLARNVSAETGSGTVVQKMGVAVAAINRARLRSTDVNGVLLYAPAMQAGGTYGAYGPIHGPEGVSTAPYGRWASTSQDPTVQDIHVAAFALSGKATSYFHGADDQYGAKYFGVDRVIADVKKKARKGNYWVGHIPGVNPMEVFLYTQRKDISADSPLGRKLVADAIRLLDDPRTRYWVQQDRTGGPSSANVPWAAGTDRVCKLRGRIPAGAIALLGLSAAAMIGYVFVRSSERGGRGEAPPGWLLSALWPRRSYR